MRQLQDPIKHSAYLRASRHRSRAHQLNCQINDLTADEIEYLLLKASHCAICHKPFINLQDKSLDHIISAIKGGANTLMNIQIICRKCNSKKNTQAYTKFINGQFLLFVSSGFAPPRPKIITEKKCPGCKEIKPLSGFYKNARTKLGISSRCRDCLKIVNEIARKLYPERQREYYLRSMANPEKHEHRITKRREWRKERVEQDLDYYKKLYYKDHENNLTRAKKHREKHKGYYQEYGRKYYCKNRVLCIQLSSGWAAKHKERIQEYGRKWRAEHPDYMKNYYQAQKTFVFTKVFPQNLQSPTPESKSQNEITIFFS